nr:hypothetical protein [Tanacetum cinerariifolium]
MFINVEQLEKKLDKEDFQEIGSMAALMKSTDETAQHKREYDNWVNERQMQTTEEKVDTSKALDASLVDKKSSGTKSKEHDTSSILGNDAPYDDADIRPIYDEEPMAETVGLRWVLTGRILTSITTKVEKEPLNGSNADITNQYECKQTLDRQDSYITTNVGITIPPSHNNAEEKIDNMRRSTLQDKQPSMNITSTSAPSTPTNVHAEENTDNQAEKGEHLQDNEFTNPFCAPPQEEVESPSHNIGNSNVPTFNQP